MASKPPAVVAELGRPETPEETAARKAEAARLRTSHQSTLNLVLALLASLAIVAFLVAVVVRPDSTPREPVDYAAIASSVDEDAPLLAPPVPADWYANSARLTTEAGVRTWVVGFVTGSSTFIAMEQGIDVAQQAIPAWLDATLEGRADTGTIDIAGIEWTVYDHRDDPDPGNFAYSLFAVIDGSAVVLHGTAAQADFEALAATLAAGAQQ